MTTTGYILLIILMGSLIGSLRVAHVSLGSSGILLTAMVFGHFGVAIPSIVQNLGLALFVTTVSLLSAQAFVTSIRSSAVGHIVTGLVTVFVGTVLCAVFVQCGIPRNLSIGLMTGALTSTPGFAMAVEMAEDSMTAAGYGIAYPFGVIAVVLFVQTAPRFLPGCVHSGRENETESVRQIQRKKIVIDPGGMSVIILTALLGVMLGSVTIPLPMNCSVTLGSSGGPLVTGLIVGNMKAIGPFSLDCPRPTLTIVRDLSLALFFAGAGTQSGAGFVEIVREYGGYLFLCGAVMTVIPMFVSMLFAYRLFKMDSTTSLSTVCGAMTSSPSLGALSQVIQSDTVAAGYMATYPVALISVVLGVQILESVL